MSLSGARSWIDEDFRWQAGEATARSGEASVVSDGASAPSAVRATPAVRGACPTQPDAGPQQRSEATLNERRGGAVAVDVEAVEAAGCGAMGCRCEGPLFRATVDGETRVLCDDHLGGWLA